MEEGLMELRSTSGARLALDTTEDAQGLRMARATTRAMLEQAGVNGERVEDCLLVVGELAGNVIQHARSAEGAFQLLVECGEEEIQLTIIDFGRGFDPGKIPPVGSVRGDGRVGGFGLPLVRTLCRQSEWHPSPGGTTVRAAISLGPREEDLPAPFAFDLDALDAYDLDDLLPAASVASAPLYPRVTN
jgi:anti-sigma regulatory factor (Ser/Thr protein kinase)